jgi:hypothetical protein
MRASHYGSCRNSLPSIFHTDNSIAFTREGDKLLRSRWNDLGGTSDTLSTIYGKSGTMPYLWGVGLVSL